MIINKKQFGLVAFSLLILMTSYAALFNWFNGLGGTGSHADVYNHLFTTYWSLGVLIGGGVYVYFLWLMTTSVEDETEEMPKLGEIPLERGNGKVAMAITVVITLFLLVLSNVTFDSIDFFEKYDEHTTEESFTVKVTGYQYYWNYEYPNGINFTSASGPLKIPVDVPVVLEVTSGDVFHSYALPEHRIKVDSIPGRSNFGWIEAEETGIYPVRCFELCGAYHSDMMGELEVVEKSEFDTWYTGGGN
ncbi:MAG TPA: cytochrome c oxidase subunit II [Candidatus Thalassarchaeaceae archaeon]|jgi:cytochrome c oxidase subunit 2|nr:cytochrome c oxidase subunit II [Candidatus Poseidoniaceae archaeon]HJM18938.1 cytochrome c oxidase subunit II [Candidatus Thalassarchaeaceae archaeon]HJM87022.1 cytochrome c oxidase subunit II [Candidatus Thalassarchaeaceae archaeon]